MNIPDDNSESLETIFGLKKCLNFFMRMRIRSRDLGIYFTLDRGSGMEKIRIRDPGINIQDPQHRYSGLDIFQRLIKFSEGHS